MTATTVKRVGASIMIGDEEDGLHTLFVRGVNELHFSIKVERSFISAYSVGERGIL
jgi:hypothetical protein